MQIITPYENGHWQFIALTDGHAFRQINPSGLVLMDNTKIAICDSNAEYILNDGTNCGWMGFKEFVELYLELNKNV